MADQIDFYELFDYVPNSRFVSGTEGAKEAVKDKDKALLPARFILNPTDPGYSRKLQQQWTVTGSCVTQGGKIFFAYFSSGKHSTEDIGVYHMLLCSEDGGRSFYDCLVVEAPDPEKTRLFDLVPWIDERGRLWLFWNQCYGLYDGRFGVWASCCDDPDAQELVFSDPVRICNGITCRTPIVTANGDWLLCTSLWDPRSLQGLGSELGKEVVVSNWLPDELGVSVYRSKDQGQSYEKISSGIRFPYSTFDEPCMAELKDGTLWMWIRGLNCVAETFSHDGGYTWTAPVQSKRFIIPNSRFHFGRLKSGNLLLVANHKPDMSSFLWGRNHLTALLSKDDGKTWEGVMMIDEREGVEQPGFSQTEDGMIYISYGRAPTIAGEGLFAMVTEEDILAGKIVNPESRLRVVVGKAEGICNHPEYDLICQIARDYNIEM